MVETLALKVAAWEEERGLEFSYDGVSNFTESFVQIL
jgi:hypothetical protein